MHYTLEWIPTSECVPNSANMMLISCVVNFDDGTQYEYVTLGYFLDGKGWRDGIGGDRLECIGIQVVAWTALPPPYQRKD